MPRELTPAELADLLRTTERSQAKPAPVSMRAAIARGAVAGLGVVMALGGSLFWVQAPLDTLTVAPLVAGVVLAGVVMLVSAIPSEKIAPALLTVRRIQQVQATVSAAEFRKRKAYEAVEATEAQAAARLAELEKTLNHMRAQYKVLEAENNQLRAQLNPKSVAYTTAEPDDPDTLEKARYILERWFATLHTDDDGKTRGEWLSREDAEKSQWSQKQHAKAVGLLKRAGLVTARGRFYEVLPTYTSLPAALYKLDTYYSSKRREPVIPKAASLSYVETE